jgi:riboflavin synthase
MGTVFTGLIEQLGSVVRVAPGPVTEVWIRCPSYSGRLTRGESIAVDGACLTVVETQGDMFKIEATPETLRRTTLGTLCPEDRVNLERAMRLDDRLGGHLVLGHVDAVSEVLKRNEEGGSVVMEFGLPSGLARFFVEKGSVTVDGISLTVNALSSDSFSVALIPETQVRTTLAKKGVGTKVNVEADLIGKYVARLFEARSGAKAPSITADRIRSWGFGS